MTVKTSLPKIAVIGAGAVGMACAYGIVMQGLARELVLVDLNERLAEGEAVDLSHATSYVGAVDVHSGGYEACRGADIFVVTAGRPQQEGETRLDLLAANAGIIQTIMGEIERVADDPIVILITNPVDVMTAVATQAGGGTPGRVFGSGTVLDTARFRRLLADHCRVEAKSVHAHVLGEHGDSEVCVWSRANVSNIPLLDFCRQRGTELSEAAKEAIETRVRRAAYEIIERKGATAYGIGAATCRILDGILRDAKTILTVSAPAGGAHGLAEDVCLSLPCVVGAGGVEQVLETSLDAAELASLRESGRIIHEACATIRTKLC